MTEKAVHDGLRHSSLGMHGSIRVKRNPRSLGVARVLYWRILALIRYLFSVGQQWL